MKSEDSIHSDFKLIEQLLDNFNVWENPSKKEEVEFREYIRDVIVSKVLDSESNFNVKHGRNVDKENINPRDFQSTKKLEIKKVDDEKYGEIYKMSVCISDINVDSSNRRRLYFNGIVSREKGLEAKKPIVIRRK